MNEKKQKKKKKQSSAHLASAFILADFPVTKRASEQASKQPTFSQNRYILKQSRKSWLKECVIKFHYFLTMSSYVRVGEYVCCEVWYEYPRTRQVELFLSSCYLGRASNVSASFRNERKIVWIVYVARHFECSAVDENEWVQRVCSKRVN